MGLEVPSLGMDVEQEHQGQQLGQKGSRSGCWTDHMYGPSSRSCCVHVCCLWHQQALLLMSWTREHCGCSWGCHLDTICVVVHVADCASQCMWGCACSPLCACTNTSGIHASLATSWTCKWEWQQTDSEEKSPELQSPLDYSCHNRAYLWKPPAPT